MSNVAGLVRLVIGRAAATPGLATIRLLGPLLAVVLVAGVATYSTAMSDAMLQASLRGDPASTIVAVNHAGPPLTPMLMTSLDHYVRGQERQDLVLPLSHLHIHHYTSQVGLYRLGHLGHPPLQPELAQVALDYFGDLAANVHVVAGTVGRPTALYRPEQAVAISLDMARALKLRLGDRVVYSADGRATLGPALRVVGIYTPRDAASDYWDLDAAAPGYRALVALTPAAFQAVATGAPDFAPDYYWRYDTNLSAVHYADSSRILGQVARLTSKLQLVSPGTALITSLDLGIGNFLAQYSLLPYILLLLVVPLVALVLYAAAVVSRLVLDRQASEIVLLRSRGAARAQVFTLYVLEGGLLGVLAMLLGPLLGLPLARLIGGASGFLQFAGGLPVALSLSGTTMGLAGATVLLGILVEVLPALGLARRSMAAFRQEQTRQSRPPLWQRLFLDLAGMAIAVYGLAVLHRQGAVTAASGGLAIAGDPLIGFAPLLFAVALTLLISRILPRLAAQGVSLLGHVVSPAAHVALQSLARAPRQPMRLVQLCTLTLTLGVFAATVAGVEGSNRADQQLYRAGAPVRLEEFAGYPPQPRILPLAMHLRLPGVRAAMPALRFESRGTAVNMTSTGTTVNVLGIDPATARRVIWFRPDFAEQPLDHLLALLAGPVGAALVSDSFAQATGLHVGDAFDVTLSTGAGAHLTVAAVVHYFPTLDPAESPFVVTNLAYLQKASASSAPSEVWMATDPSPATVDRVVNIARGWGLHIVPYQGLAAAFVPQNEPLTAGIYGVVSAGFLVAIAMTLLGFFAYAQLSLRGRLAQFAALRALGLSAGQLCWLLLCEQLFLLGASVVGGILTGVLTTRLFLPFMPFARNTLPPFLVTMPWPAVGAFTMAVVLVSLLLLSVHALMLLRLPLGRVLRLGEG